MDQNYVQRNNGCRIPQLGLGVFQIPENAEMAQIAAQKDVTYLGIQFYRAAQLSGRGGKDSSSVIDMIRNSGSSAEQ